MCAHWGGPACSKNRSTFIVHLAGLYLVCCVMISTIASTLAEMTCRYCPTRQRPRPDDVSGKQGRELASGVKRR